jgi:hypothetical protein
MRFVVLLGFVSVMLLVYGLAIKALGRRSRGDERPRLPEEVEVDERARREAVARWRRRARQDRGR